jgi:hypothetical protein
MRTGLGTFMGGPENRTPDVLNKVQKYKGYVCENVTWSQDGKSLEVHVRPRERSCPTCSECRRKWLCMTTS